jgi:hypothetical protein
LADLSAVEHTEMNPKSANAMMAEATATSMSVKASLDCPGPADWTG